MKTINAENAREVIARHMLPDVQPIVVDLEKSSGNYIVDAKSGQRYLDCFSYIASNPVGHNHPALSDPDFEKELLRAAKSKPSNADFYTVEMARFVDVFSRVAMHDQLPHLFFIEGGALAVENAMKTAFDWKVRKNLAAGSGEKGSQIAHFRQAFHGRSGYTLSVTNTRDPRKIMYFPKFDWPRILNPKATFPLEGENLSHVIELEQQAAAELRTAFEQRGPDIAGILIEPIQGEGGDNHFRPEFLAELRKIADEFEALLIYDEVQTGVGLTGTFWAFEQLGPVPDVIAFGKKMQVCGICASRRIDAVEHNVFQEASRINSTWGGGLADMVRARRYLEIIEKEELLKNAQSGGELLLEGLKDIQSRYEAVFSNARGRGFMCAIDAPSEESRNRIRKGMFERNTLVLVCGERSIRFRPSLTFSESEIGRLLSALEDTAKTL